ncbi:MAG: hypothetical protein IKK17_01955 [Oscillospiraceae bacterium]|nr:hypothetical protein [Oscillospiraceae bacterium]
MPDYKKMYITMFRAAELAVQSLEQDETKDNAIFILKFAQLACENIYITSEDDETPA